MTCKVYEVSFYAATGTTVKLYNNYDEAAVRYNDWCELFDWDKDDGAEVLRVQLTEINNGVRNVMAQHF